MKKRFIKKQMDIAAQIHELLEKKGWTQKELSEKSGIPEQTLSTIRSGHANPTLKTLVNIEEALDTDIIVAPKFYKKDLNRNGFTITKQSLAEDFHLDFDDFLRYWIENNSNKRSLSFKVYDYTDNGYEMSVKEIKTQKELKAA